MAQDWWKLLHFDRTQLIVCWKCSSLLSHDAQWNLLLLVGFFALLAIPASGLLPFDTSFPWFLCVFAVYMPFYLTFMRLRVVQVEDLQVTSDHEANLNTYSERRKRVKSTGAILLLCGLLLMLGGGFWLPLPAGVAASLLGLLAAVVGIVILTLTRCPMCKKLSVTAPLSLGTRCIHCHRDLGVDN